jgi:hypothetical protein
MNAWQMAAVVFVLSSLAAAAALLLHAAYLVYYALRDLTDAVEKNSGLVDDQTFWRDMQQTAHRAAAADRAATTPKKDPAA